MGEIVEWLVFGFMTHIMPDGDPTNPLRIVCWGSHRNLPETQISFGSYAGAQLYRARPPVRMTAPQMRVYLARMKIDEDAYNAAEDAAEEARLGALNEGSTSQEALAVASRARAASYAEGSGAITAVNADDEDAEGSDLDVIMGERGTSPDYPEDIMDVDPVEDVDEHYINRPIPRGPKYKRYRHAIRCINSERSGIHNPERRMNKELMYNNLEIVMVAQAPPRTRSEQIWDYLRLPLALLVLLAPAISTLLSKFIL